MVRIGFCVLGNWNSPSNTDSRTANVPISRSIARHRRASNSPDSQSRRRDQTDDGLVRLVQVLEQPAERLTGNQGWLLLESLCGNLTPRAGLVER
jgi:hypothetical protein